MGITDKLPLLNSKSKSVRIVGYVVYAFVVLMILGALSGPATNTEGDKETTGTVKQSAEKEDPEATAYPPTSDEVDTSLTDEEKAVAEDWLKKGKDFETQAKYNEAIDAYHEAIRINPQLKKAWDSLEAADVHYGESIIANDDSGWGSNALSYCSEAVKINPDNEKAWLCKARSVRWYENVAPDQYKGEAIKAYGEVIRINPSNADAWYESASIYLDEHEEDKAADAYNEVVRINPQHDEAWNAIGELHAARGEYDEAIEAFDKAIQLKPGNAHYQENRRQAVENVVGIMKPPT